MKKTAICIFAHPDDEAFGPSGTIHLLTQEYDVHLICASRGDAGNNHLEDKETELAKIREAELRASSAILGVKKVYFLDIADGSLCNNIYHKVANQIQEIIDPLKPELFMTYEPRGVSGHIDHVAMSMITTFVFEKSEYAKTLLYYCLDELNRSLIGPYFIYFPPGYPQSQIDKTVDVSKVVDIKLQAMKQHKSQKKDMDNILARRKQLPTEEYFLVKKK